MRTLNQKGSVLIFFTLGFALLATFIGFALDFGRAYLEKARIARLVDGAALAAAKVLKGQPGYEDEATKAACDSMVMNGAPVVITGMGVCESTTVNYLTVSVDFVDAPVPGGPPMRNVRVWGTEQMPTTFLRFLSFLVPGDYSTLTIQAMAQAGPERPVDLMLVLDRSGSMSAEDGTGTPKIEALKTAVDGFLDLSNTFSANDRIGMVSFASRGCGNASGGESSSTAANCPRDVGLDFATSSHLDVVRNRVSGLNAAGGTNTMEALRSARAELAPSFDDAERVTSRKAVLLITDGQPTFMRRDTDAQCKDSPAGGDLLANGNSNASGGPFSPNGCIQGVPSVTSDNTGYLLRHQLNPAPGPSCPYLRVPGTWTSTDCPSGTQSRPTGITAAQSHALYEETIACTRSLSGCVTNGAMYEANLIRNCGQNNSACNSGGNHHVVIFAIAIGRVETSPQGSLDNNAKCLLTRMANADDIVNAATGSIEKMATVCNGVFTTSDGDTHADLKVGCPGGNCAIDATQEKGKVFTVDMNGNVTEQLNLIFQEIAALLKLRLVL